jgi:heme exporter protein B
VSALAALFVRDLRLAGRIGGGGATGVVFFLALVSVAPFALGPDMNLLSRIGPALLWIAALLATLIGLDRLFQADEEDGSLALMMASTQPLELIVLVKCAAHWVTTGLPLVVAAPVFGLMLGLEGAALWGVTVTLLAGTPALTLIGAIGAALTASMRRGGLLLAVLVIPFTVPVMIFGVSAAAGARGAPTGFGTPFAILCGLSLLSLAGAPFAAAAALRLTRD